MGGKPLLPLLWYRYFVERDGLNVSSSTSMVPRVLWNVMDGASLVHFYGTVVLWNVMD